MPARNYFTLAVLVIASACAKSPESISASYVADEKYTSRTCQQMLAEYARVSDLLIAASNQQSAARTSDTVGVLLIGLPLGSMGGDDVEVKVAQLKGEQEAIRRAMGIKRCA